MPVVGHDVAVIQEFLVADCALPTLRGDLSIQQLPHLGRRPEFPISPGVIGIFDTLHTEPHGALF
jgi:hypothetical protein